MRLLRAQPDAVVWYLGASDARPLDPHWPMLEAVCTGQGMALSLWRCQSGTSLVGQALRRVHVDTGFDHRAASENLPSLVARLLQQALHDHEQGLLPAQGAAPVSLMPGPQTAARPAWFRCAMGRWRGWLAQQRARWLSEQWRIGLVDAPVSAWLDPGFRPKVRWLTGSRWGRYLADPAGLPGDPNQLFAETFDEATGQGHIARITLDAQGNMASCHRLPVGRGQHVSFPQTLSVDGQVYGVHEARAERRCTLYALDPEGHWTPQRTLLNDVAVIDPTLFRHEGRFWLAYTDGDLGEQDNLCLHHAERLDGPWLPHANNPVRTDVRGARMAGAFFEHEGALYRPGQDCLGAYGRGVVLHKVLRCTPECYTEEVVRHVTPDPQGPCPDGLHTLSAWGERTLIDGKKLGFNPVVLCRKLRQRLGLMPHPKAISQAASADASISPPRLQRLSVVIPHLRMGGGELSMLRLAIGLHKLGVEVELIVNTLRTAQVAVPEGLRLTVLGHEGTVSAQRALTQALRTSRPQLVFSAFPHTNVATVAAVRQAKVGARCVVSEHAPLRQQIAREGGWRYRVLPPVVRWAYPKADAVVAVSEGVRADLQVMLGERCAVHVIANPVIDDAQPLSPEVPAQHPWLKDPALAVVMSVSRLSVEKDIPTLMRAFATVHAQRPQTRLMLLGEGPDRSRLEALRQSLGLDDVVQLLGQVEAPRQWMQHAQAFALASLYEGFGNVLIEALSCGLPVVATDCPVGPREVLAGGRHGQLVPVGDTDAMARALLKALDQGSVPEATCHHAAGYTASRASQAYLRLFESLL
ncbi:glycosyltransferase [Aquabacterium sp.]|uniref:glycosyltransferase n=1 Tax=Aquabacterium sp. TaxID=1872578 RepID=UPI0025C46356|nr:glycosyltransferase [Aquabacterium sp.]